MPAKTEQPIVPWTPGPWTVIRDALHKGNRRVISFHPAAIAKVYADEPFNDDPKATANAHLIAAAPDLYEALATAAKRFRQYESLHRAKRSDEGNLKADNNADLAEMCERALTQARGTPHD